MCVCVGGGCVVLRVRDDGGQQVPLFNRFIHPSFLFLGTMEVNKYCPRCYTCYSPTSSFLIPPPLSFLSQYLSFRSVTHSSSSSLLRCHYHPTPSSSHSIIIPLFIIPRLLIPLFSPVRLIYTNIGYTLPSFLLPPTRLTCSPHIY